MSHAAIPMLDSPASAQSPELVAYYANKPLMYRNVALIGGRQILHRHRDQHHGLDHVSHPSACNELHRLRARLLEWFHKDPTPMNLN